MKNKTADPVLLRRNFRRLALAVIKIAEDDAKGWPYERGKEPKSRMAKEARKFLKGGDDLDFFKELIRAPCNKKEWLAELETKSVFKEEGR